MVKGWTDQQCPEVSFREYVKPCADPRHGHFQANVAMVAAKALKKNPREIGQELAAYCRETCDLIEEPQVAGPGFVNFVIKPEAILREFVRLEGDPHLGVAQADGSETFVVDFSSPNVAKAMHVGHIRSTILGDTLARILRALGHRVITDNHLGDWGTQFGKILLGYKRKGCPEFSEGGAIGQMEALYKEINEACNQDESLLEEARRELVKLQSGDEENVLLWELFREASQQEFDSIYERLGVQFDETLGESFYNPWLKEVVQDLRDKGIARESEGAIVVFFDGVEGLGDMPFLVEKSDGAALYATTDLATVRYRMEQWKPDCMIYVTDGRQQTHFRQLFETCRRWGYGDVRLEHVWFGSIQGKDKKPLKTREGAPPRLRDLLDQAVAHAVGIIREKRDDLPEDKERELAEVIGIGAVKYADLCQNRNLDYVFDLDKLVAFDGNTAPYLINAYVRTRSILRKADSQGDPSRPPVAEHELEYEIIRKLDDFGGVVKAVSDEYRPHVLCLYLYELASTFHRFFEFCPVLKAESDELCNTRLRICKLTGDVLARGLNLLGIRTVEEM